MGKNIDNFTIGQTEEVIKTYLYHSVSSSDKEIGDSVKNLIVTTKRLILESKNNNGFTRDEFPIDMIDGVNTKFYQSKKSKIWLLLMILGIGFIGPAIGVKDILSNVFGGLVIILIALGALLFIGGLVYLIRKKRKQSFSLTFYSTKQLYDFSSVSAENFIIKERKQRKGAKPKQIKVLSKITPAAVVMLNQIHALIQDIKEFKNQVRLYKKMQLDKDLTALEYQERYDALLERLRDKYNS